MLIYRIKCWLRSIKKENIGDGRRIRKIKNE